MVALLASHSIAAADAVSGQPFDSTPAILDSQFFVETMLDSTIPGAVRLPSDLSLASDNRTICTWQSFIEDESSMRSNFAAAMLQLSLVAQDESNMIDCSDVVPGSGNFGLLYSKTSI